MSEPNERPVLSGLIALVAVAMVIGVIGGLAILVASKVVGVDGDATSTDDSATSGSTLFLPEPTITSETVTPEQGASPTGPAPSTTESASGISLSAAQQSVSAMQQIDLTGTYAGGEGAILQVQRFEGGEWSDFPVTMSVTNQTFATYVQTSQAGRNRFRVIDTDKDVVSNEVVVKVG